MDEPRTDASGRSYENGCIGVFTVAGGQIQQVREYMDTLYARNVAFGEGGEGVDYVQPSPADTSAAVSSIRSTAAGGCSDETTRLTSRAAGGLSGHPPQLVGQPLAR